MNQTLKERTIFSISLIIMSVFIACQNTAAEKKAISMVVKVPSNEMAEKFYNTAEAKWKSQSVNNYKMKIRYHAFSPLSGIWEIDITDGNITGWRFNDMENSKDHEKFAKKLNMDRLFELAKNSFSNTEDSPFSITAEYDESDGYVKKVSKIRNPAYKGSIPTDKTYTYEVIDLNIK